MLGSVASVASRGQAWGPHGPLCAGLSPGAGRMLPSVAWAVGSPSYPPTALLPLPSWPFTEIIRRCLLCRFPVSKGHRHPRHPCRIGSCRSPRCSRGIGYWGHQNTKGRPRSTCTWFLELWVTCTLLKPGGRCVVLSGHRVCFPQRRPRLPALLSANAQCRPVPTPHGLGLPVTPRVLQKRPSTFTPRGTSALGPGRRGPGPAAPRPGGRACKPGTGLGPGRTARRPGTTRWQPGLCGDSAGRRPRPRSSRRDEMLRPVC